MKTDIKNIGKRIKGLREGLDYTPEMMAERLGVSVEDYLDYEAGSDDLSVSFLQKIEREFDVDVSTLLFGMEPRMSSYFITRKDGGMSVERVSAYNYQSLTSGFTNNVAECFIVTVEAKPLEQDCYKNIHAGQEFDYILEGSMTISLNGKEFRLDEGDSIYFDSSLPHGMKANDGRQVKFLAVILYP